MPIPEDELIDRLRRGYDAFNRGDFDAAVEFAHPDIVFVRAAGQSDLKGADAIRAWMEPDAFESQVSEPLEIEIAGNRALIRQLTRARGAGSGIEVEVESWAVWTFDDDGTVTRMENFLEHDEDEARRALEAN